GSTEGYRQGPSQDARLPARSCHVLGSESAHLKAAVNGKTVFLLLDSGSSRSLCPQKLVRPRDIKPADQKLLAANGTEIIVLGQAVIQLRISGLMIETTMLVTPQLDGILLGL
ncbi:MAG: hypothetical protein CRN43_17270, partial [Candidatus Nephrothrix sp. EaCA]